jgi:SAM-dependent methyltransferase
MERIIEVFCPRGGYVFDPFSGTGTTPITAKRLGKRYAAIDISEDYVELGKAKLRQLDQNGSIIKSSVKKAKYKVSKKQIEVYIQNVCTQLGYRPSEDEFIQHLENDAFADFSVDDILYLYPDIKTALKSGRIALK